MRQIIALVITGMILGAVLMNIYLADKMDELYIDREKLRVELYETKERLKITEDQWQSHRTLLVRKIEVEFLQQERDPFTEIWLREAVARLTQSLIGENLEKIPHTLVVHLLDQRIVEVEGMHYRLQVKTVVIAEKITYVLHYVQQSAEGDDEP